MDKRVIFPKGKQKEFLLNTRKEFKLTWPEFARKIGVKRKTLEKAYRYENCSLPLKVFSKIAKLKNIKEKELIDKCKVKVVDFIPDATKLRYLGEHRAKLKETNILYKKEVSTIDNSTIKTSKSDQKKCLIFPERLTPNLAEEIGIHIGDGFLSDKKHDFRVKGDKEKEREYYNNFIRGLYKMLYNINVKIKEYEESYGFELYSQGVWNFKTKALGIEAGKKDNMTFPSILKVNDKEILCSFIRGLFDTDGSICFKSQNKIKKYYPVISIALISKNIIFGAAEMLTMLGFEPYRYQDKLGYWVIVLNGYERLERYYEMIGWSNPKHLRKLKEWKIKYPMLAKNIDI